MKIRRIKLIPAIIKEFKESGIYSYEELANYFAEHFPNPLIPHAPTPFTRLLTSSPYLSKALRGMADEELIAIAEEHGIVVNDFIIKPKEELEEEPPQKALPAPPKELPKPPTKAALKKFLKHEFEIPNLKTLPIAPKFAAMLEKGFNETRVALEAGCYLSVFLLCGSVLESVFLGLAEKNPERFNEAASSKNKTNGNKTEQFRQWGLKDFIDATVKIGFITDETGMLGDFLRHCRNYIHPYKEASFGDEPDKESAELCFQYLQLAIVSIAKETNKKERKIK